MEERAVPTEVEAVEAVEEAQFIKQEVVGLVDPQDQGERKEQMEELAVLEVVAEPLTMTGTYLAEMEKTDPQDL